MAEARQRRKYHAAWSCVVCGLMVVEMTEGQAQPRIAGGAQGDPDGLVDTSKLLLEVEVGLAATGAERIAALERQYEKAQAFVEIAKARHKAARGTEVSVFDAQAYSLEVQIGLPKAGGKPKKAEK